MGEHEKQGKSQVDTFVKKQAYGADEDHLTKRHLPHPFMYHRNDRPSMRHPLGYGSNTGFAASIPDVLLCYIGKHAHFVCSCQGQHWQGHDSI